MCQKVILYIQLLTFHLKKKSYSCTKYYFKMAYGFHYVGAVRGYLTTF